jgi:hypothetical protein
MDKCMKVSKITVSICLIVGLFGSTAFAGSPTSDGSLLETAFDDANMPKWFNTGEYPSNPVGFAPDVVYDASAGNPAGSIRIDSDTPYEAWARANMAWAPADWNSWVTEFDVKLNDSTGGDFMLYGAYASLYSMPVDIEIAIATNDWVLNHYGTGQHAWDFKVIDANNPNGTSVVARLRADQWHHFSIYRRPDNMVELWVDDASAGVYEARNPDEIYGNIQIGDVTQNSIWGDVNWDNFKVGEPNLSGVIGKVLFTDDFSSGDTSKWKRVEGLAGYDGSLGNPAGSFNVSTGTPTEGFGRPNMYSADSAASEWISEFDVKLSETSSSGDGFLIYAAYAPTFSAAIDIEIQIATNDYVWNHYGSGQNAWDFRVIDATGGQSVVARLRADQWHHFKVRRVVATGVVDLYVDGNYVDSYTAMNPGEILGEVQIGDVTGGGMWGVVNWDNFLIYEPWQGYCGDDAHPVRNGDVNEDCHVDYNDLLILTENWLLCDDPTKPDCFN